MNQYILEWINEVCLTLVLDENDSLPEPEDPNIVQLNVESMDVKEKMLMIGKVTFGDDQLIMPKLYENYCEYLTNYKNTSEYDNNTDIVILQEVCFLCAVHEKSIDREFFIENIMNLKSESQIYMMEIIKQQQAELNEDNDTNDSCAVDNEVNVPKKEKSVLQTNGSSACEDESGASGDVLENTTANIDVGSDVTSIKTLENDITNLNNKLIDMELLLLEKDDIISSTKLQVEQIQSEYNELLSREAAQSQIINEYELIKDDLEILKSKSEQLEKAENQIESYRNKIDELADVKMQYQQEMKDHAEHYSALLNAENEIKNLNKIKNQVESYRNENNEYKIQINDLKFQLNEKQHLVLNYEANEQNNNTEQMNSNINSSNLSQSLKIALERIQELEMNEQNLSSLSQTYTELNPVLMNEMEKLKNENKLLKENIKQTSNEYLDELNKTNEDVNNMNQNLQKKLLITNESLKQSKMENLNLNTLLNKKTQEFDELLAEMKEVALFHEEDCNSEYLRKMDIIHSLQDKQQDTLQTLSVVQMEAETLNITNNELENSLKQTLTDLEALKLSKSDQEKNYEQIISDLKQKYQSDFDKFEKTKEDDIQLLKVTHKEAINVELKKIENLMLNLDEERLKKRRIEREKKFHESEAHRLKIQMNSNNSTSSTVFTEQQTDEYNCALKQYKVLEEELKNAKNEILELKNNGAATGSRNENLVKNSNAMRLNKSNAASVLNNNHNSNVPSNQLQMEQNELSEKRIHQLMNEKRELLSKNLEENKEKREISQKYICIEKEFNQLQNKMTKLTLEKERVERRLEKALSNNETSATKRSNATDRKNVLLDCSNQI